MCYLYEHFQKLNNLRFVKIIVFIERRNSLRTLTAVPDDLGSVSSTLMAAHNCLYLQFQEIWHPHTDRHICRQGKTPVHIRKKEGTETIMWYCVYLSTIICFFPFYENGSLLARFELLIHVLFLLGAG